MSDDNAIEADVAWLKTNVAGLRMEMVDLRKEVAEISSILLAEARNARERESASLAKAMREYFAKHP